MIILVCFILLGLIALHLIFRAVMDGIDDIPQDYDMCDDCDAGWCDAYPNDEDCRKWRERNE